MMMKSVLLLVGSVLLASAQGCTSRCGDKKVQVFFMADMSMKQCNDDTMTKYLDGLVEFAKEAESECPGGFSIGYGILGDTAEVNPLFCHWTLQDVGGSSSGLANVVGKFDFKDGAGLSTKAHIGEIYHRVSYQNQFNSDALKIIITMTNDEFGMNNGTKSSQPDVGACNPGGCDCPGSYYKASDLSSALTSHDVQLGFIVTHEVADFYRTQVSENNWNAVVEEGIQVPPTQQLWNIVQAFTGC